MLYYKKLLCKSIEKLRKFYKSSLKSFVNLNPGLDSTYVDTTENAESLRVEEENL